MTCRDILVTLLAAAAVLCGCAGGGISSGTPSQTAREPVVEGFVFSWGAHEPKNVLDTIHGTFTKDMVLASPLTVPFTIDPREIASVARRLAAIDFWSYPSQFVSRGSGARLEPPAGMQNSAVLTVVSDRGSKTVEWSGGYYADDGRAEDLHELAGYIVRLIEADPRYKELPEAQGGYQ